MSLTNPINTTPTSSKTVLFPPLSSDDLAGVVDKIPILPSQQKFTYSLSTAELVASNTRLKRELPLNTDARESIKNKPLNELNQQIQHLEETLKGELQEPYDAAFAHLLEKAKECEEKISKESVIAKQIWHIFEFREEMIQYCHDRISEIEAQAEHLIDQSKAELDKQAEELIKQGLDPKEFRKAKYELSSAIQSFVTQARSNIRQAITWHVEALRTSEKIGTHYLPNYHTNFSSGTVASHQAGEIIQNVMDELLSIVDDLYGPIARMAKSLATQIILEDNSEEHIEARLNDVKTFEAIDQKVEEIKGKIETKGKELFDSYKKDLEKLGLDSHDLQHATQKLQNSIHVIITSSHFRLTEMIHKNLQAIYDHKLDRPRY